MTMWSFFVYWRRTIFYFNPGDAYVECKDFAPSRNLIYTKFCAISPIILISVSHKVQYYSVQYYMQF